MPPVLLSAEIRASALRMSKFRGSITFPIFSLSTLSRQHYCSPPKTRYCWLVRPSQTGFSPARLPALCLGAQSRFVVALLYIRFSKNESDFLYFLFVKTEFIYWADLFIHLSSSSVTFAQIIISAMSLSISTTGEIKYAFSIC